MVLCLIGVRSDTMRIVKKKELLIYKNPKQISGDLVEKEIEEQGTEN
jgi:hypothetical protein